MNVKKVSSKQIKKGMIVAAQGSFKPTNQFDVRNYIFISIMYSGADIITYPSKEILVKLHFSRGSVRP